MEIQLNLIQAKTNRLQQRSRAFANISANLFYTISLGRGGGGAEFYKRGAKRGGYSENSAIEQVPEKRTFEIRPQQATPATA